TAAGSTGKPTSSRRRTIPSHSCSATAGSCSTSTSDGHVASASPRRIPGRMPAASAAAVTGPTTGSEPGSGASAAARVARRGRSRSAARSSNPGMRMQATIGTDVLHEHVFLVKAGAHARAVREAGPRRASDAGRVAVLAGIGAADERVALEEDRLAATEAERLRLAHRPVAEALEVEVALPQPLLEPDDVAVDAEAGAVERGLRVEAVVDERRDELHVRLRLDEAAHDAERAVEAPVAEEHPRDDRVVRAAARLDRARDGEAGAAVLQHDAGSGGDDAGAERLEQALDEGGGHALLVDRAQVDGAAGRLADGPLLPVPPPLEVPGLDQVRHVRPVPHPCETVLEGELGAADATREARGRALEQTERLERDDSLRRRR